MGYYARKQKQKNHNFFQSLACALEGLVTALTTERNLKFHCFAAVVTGGLAFFLSFQLWQWGLLLLAIGLVMICELINTAIEAVVDLACQGQIHPLAKKAKDVAAAAVLLASFIAAFIGIILFGPYLLEFLGKMMP